jgi:hypothetical protein
LSAKLLPNFADTGCHVVSVTDPYSRILGFLDYYYYYYLLELRRARILVSKAERDLLPHIGL